MVLPLIPLAAGAAVGVGGAVLGGMFAGKKETVSNVSTYSPTYGQVYHAPGETYAPQIQYAPQYGYAYTGPTYIIDSPGASSKKETLLSQSSSPAQSGEWDVPQSYETSPNISPGSSEGLNSETLLMLGLLAVAGIIGYGLVTGGKK